MTSGKLSRLRLPLLMGIVLLAFGVRVLGLGILDLSDDEAFFVRIAHFGTYVQLAASDEPHPPLYLALLQGWMLPAGVTEYAVRFVSVLFGVATVAAAYQFGRRLGRERLGLAAAFVAALNPYQIFYSQTARDYQIACCFGLISVVLFLWSLRRPAVLPGYVASVLLAVFSHYYALAILLFEQVILVGWLFRRRWRGWHRWLAAEAAIAVVFLPWAAYALRTVARYEPGHGTPEIAGSALAQTFEFYSFGTAFRPADLPWLSLLGAALLALGVAGVLRVGGGRALALAAGYQLAPIVFGLVTLVHTTQFGPRFLFLGSPGYLVIVAGAVLFLVSRPAAMLAPAAAVGGLAGLAIYNTTFSGHFTDKAYSRLAAHLAQRIGPRDSVVLDGISQSLQYWYYGQLRDGIGQPVRILPLKADGGGADGTPIDLPLTEQALRQVASGSSGIWLIEDDSLRYDPKLDVQRLLTEQQFRTSSQAFRGQRLDYYAVAQVEPPVGADANASQSATAPSPAVPHVGQPAGVDAHLDGLTLAQVARPEGSTPAGQAIPLRLVWRADRSSPPFFKVSLRLIDAAGQVVSQDDEIAGGGFWDQSWQAGSTREDRRGLPVPVGTLPGTYNLQLVAYDASSGRELGPAVGLGMARIDHSAPQRAAAAGLPQVDTTIGGERLVGLQAAAQVTAGERLDLTLLWSGNPAPDAESVPISFGGVTVLHQIGGGSYPTTDWQPGDVVREVVSIRVSPGMAAGKYPLLAGDQKLAEVQVLPPKRAFSAPPIPHALSARFGDVAQLLGYDLEPAGASLNVRLIWKALSETPVSYTVFVHALADDGRILAQADVPPGTDNWDAGEFVTTSYSLGATGAAKLEIGLYDAKSGARLPVCAGASGCEQSSDHVEVAAH